MVRLHTNLDCCKRWMKAIGYEPQLNDLISVYRNANTDIILRVVGRTWDDEGNLCVELSLRNGWTVSQLEDFVHSRKLY